MNKLIERPGREEFSSNEQYYADLIPDDGRLLQHLATNITKTKDFLSSVPAEKSLFRYAEGKWTIKEIVSHLIDMERVYMYRALCISRGDKTNLPGFDEQLYVENSGANDRSIDDLHSELADLRMCTISFLSGLSKVALQRSGTANKNSISVRALAYHIAGHELHHMAIIRDRYL